MATLLILFYLLTALVWICRSRRAFEALRENPRVEVSPSRSISLSPSLPLVTILLPVKNEEGNLETCLNRLLNQDHPAKEIIVINDHSIDRTSKILSEYAQSSPNQIRVLEAPPLPKGWTGKNWALTHGEPHARGEWLLFTDADTRHEPWSLSSGLAYAEGKGLALLTLSPRCLTEGFWERVLQPVAMTFLGLWFPFRKVNDPTSSLSFGNGQYLLVRRRVYRALGGHAKVKEAFLEDFALVQEAKKRHFRIECAIGTKIYGTRMYRSFSGIWLGWRRIFFHAFGKNLFRLLKKAALVFLFSFLPFFFFPLLSQMALNTPEHFGALWGFGLFLLAVIVLTAWKAYGIVGAKQGYAFLHPLAGLIVTGILADAARFALTKKELKWR